MNMRKVMLVMVLACSVVWIRADAGERKPPLPLKELQDPGSPSYVPCPYPVARNEIIEDVKHAIRLHHGPAIGNASPESEILLELLAPDPGIHVAEIERVANRTVSFPDEFLYLILLKDREGNEVARLSLLASGLYFGGIKASRTSRPITDREEAVKVFSSHFEAAGIKKMERIFMGNRLAAYPFAPTWEIVTADDSRYYLDVNRDLYQLQKTVPSAIKTDAHPYCLPAGENELVVHDPLNDRILHLRKLN
jgi:hypothetical protein